MKQIASCSEINSQPEDKIRAMTKFPWHKIPVTHHEVSLEHESVASETFLGLESNGFIPFSRGIYVLGPGGFVLSDIIDTRTKSRSMDLTDRFTLRGGKLQEIRTHTPGDMSLVGYKHLIDDVIKKAVGSGYDIVSGKIETPGSKPILWGFYGLVEINRSSIQGSIFRGKFGFGKDGEKQRAIFQEWVNQYGPGSK